MADRKKFLRRGSLPDLDVIKIRWQAAEPPDGPGMPLRVIAQAWGKSYEAIRRIVAKESYSWVTDSLPEPPKHASYGDALIQSGESASFTSMEEFGEALLRTQAEVEKTGPKCVCGNEFGIRCPIHNRRT
jgi:hypothetical protein